MQYIIDALIVVGIAAAMLTLIIGVKHLCRKYTIGSKRHDGEHHKSSQ